MAAPTVVVCGAGVVGACVAHFFTAKGAPPTVLDAVGPACAASGKAGGFLALDWCDGSPVGPLARRSFALHQQLSEEVGGYGYRRMTTHSLSVRPGGGKAGGRRAPITPPLHSRLPAWVDAHNVAQSSVIGTLETTAQVHPELFTKALLRGVEAGGGSVRVATVTGLELEGGRLAGVRTTDPQGVQSVLPADVVVLALGPWSSLLPAWLPPGPDGATAAALPTVSGLKVHSIVLEEPTGPGAPGADALFLAYRGPDGKSLEPEVYPRPDGQGVYLCGVSQEGAALPARADGVLPQAGAAAALRTVAASVSKELGLATVLREQACFLPTTEDGLPMIGAVPGVAGAYVATGHSCWGILNAPATGEAIAELVLEGKATLDLTAFDPARGCL